MSHKRLQRAGEEPAYTLSMRSKGSPSNFQSMVTGSAIVVTLVAIETRLQFGVVKYGVPLDLPYFVDRVAASADLIRRIAAGRLHNLVDVYQGSAAF